MASAGARTTASSGSERPILFSGPMVRAILEGRKTQTRRVVKPQPFPDTCAGQPMVGHRDLAGLFAPHVFGACMAKLAPCPYGQPGDRLWVRETWRTEELDEDDEASGSDIGTDGVRFAADGVFRSIENTMEASERWVVTHNTDSRKLFSKWRPSIHMPRWACRLELELTQVRLERLQDITEEDAKAEGVMSECRGGDPRAWFAGLWNDIHSPGRVTAWETNPWVWALTFKRVEAKERAA